MAVKGLLKKAAVYASAIMIAFVLSFPTSINATERRFSMSYVFFGDTKSYTSYVDRTKNSLNEISPSYFDLNSDGTLKLADKLSIDLIKEMHGRGIKVIPFLSNHWDRELGKRALENRNILVQQIVNAVVEYGLDGVNVDIENMTEVERESYTDLVRLLRKKLPSDRTVSVAVAPNPYNWNTGWQGSYDYVSLAEYSDYLMLMAYDEHYQGGAAGPVASADFVEKSIKYALERVPAEKLVLGVPFYGRFWQNGKSYGGYGISNWHVEDFIRKYSGKVTYDYAAKSPKAVITIKATDTKPYVLGRRLDAGTYTIWYENSQSIKYKLSLVQKYNLKGAGSWSLGQEVSGTWNYYNLWLNGVYFQDVEGHWAQNSILTSALKGWMKGVSTTRFAPENSLTRAQAAVLLVRALGLEGQSTQESFYDVIGHWAENEIGIAKQNNLILGYGNGSFNPDSPISREQMAVMLNRILIGLQSPDVSINNIYEDVSPESSSWSYDAILRMTYNGILNGFPDGYFHPGDAITRSQMSEVMDKISKFIE